ncbi:MAG TPA: hypothetical protein VNO31_09305 [Umezawaea sp.]|nr:hypothetical protein [Umezawaea sp.]
MPQRRVARVLFAAALASACVLGPTASAGAAADESVGTLNVWCTSARPVDGATRYPTNFGGNQETACRKCDETARVLRLQGRITAWACEYVTPLGNYAVGWYKYVV